MTNQQSTIDRKAQANAILDGIKKMSDLIADWEEANRDDGVFLAAYEEDVFESEDLLGVLGTLDYSVAMLRGLVERHLR